VEVGVRSEPAKRGDPVLIGLAAGVGGVIGMCGWAALFWGLLHTFFHGPVLAGTLPVRYGPAATIDLPVSVEAIATVAAFVQPLAVVLLVAFNRPRLRWWAWLGFAMFVGGLLSGGVIALNPNWYGVELAASVQGGWVWACGLGLLIRRLFAWPNR
jgi:hypothetical protein